MLVEDEEGGKAGEDGLQSQQDSGVGGGKMLLGPALDGEGGRGGEEAGYGEGDEEAWGDGEVWFSFEGQGDGHDDGGDADLQCGELTGRDTVRGVGQGKEMAGEGYGAGQRKEISYADAGEEIVPGGSSRGGEEEKSGEGEEGSGCSGPAGSW